MIFQFNKDFNKAIPASADQRGWLANPGNAGKTVSGGSNRQAARTGSGMYGSLISKGASHSQWF